MKPQLAKPAFGKAAGAVLGLLLFLSPSAFGQAADTALAAKGEIEQTFTLPAGERLNIEFQVGAVGPIVVEAEWVPEGTQLSLILFKPGQMNFIAREDGCSPGVLRYQAVEHDTERGTDWRLRLVNMTAEAISGHLLLRYPYVAAPPVQ